MVSSLDHQCYEMSSLEHNNNDNNNYQKQSFFPLVFCKNSFAWLFLWNYFSKARKLELFQSLISWYLPAEDSYSLCFSNYRSWCCFLLEQCELNTEQNNGSSKLITKLLYDKIIPMYFVLMWSNFEINTNSSIVA